MSKVAIIGNASGTGVFTVASPNSNVDRVLTLPDESGTVDTLQRSGNVLQVVNFQTGAAATGTTLTPLDDTIPQITEGNQYMTLAITPTNANNILLIEVNGKFDSDTADRWLTLALHVGTTADALAATNGKIVNASNGHVISLAHRLVAGVTTELTFRIRVGANVASTLTFNGISGTGRLYGGISNSSFTITEMTP